MKLIILLFALSVYACNVNGATLKMVTPTFGLSEGPHWDPRTQRLYFVDIMANRMCSLNNTGAVNCATIQNGPVAVAVPVDGATNQFVVGSGRDILLVTWDGISNVTNPPMRKLASLDTDRNDTRINDGKVDSRGRLWIGTMGPEPNGVTVPNRGSLYMIGTDFRPQKKISPVTVSNGIAWSNLDNEMYYIDTATSQIVSYQYTPETGTITNKKVVFDVKQNNIKGAPDGMTIDTNGNLWIALFNGKKVIHVDPKQGKLLSSVDTPSDRTTSVTFGGPQYDTLYVTTSSFGLTAADKLRQPTAGAVFAVTNLNARGRSANCFVMPQQPNQQQQQTSTQPNQQQQPVAGPNQQQKPVSGQTQQQKPVAGQNQQQPTKPPRQ